MHILILCAGISAGCLLAARILIHYFQLESYQHPGYFRTLRRNPLKSVLPGCCMTVLLIAAWNLAQLLFANVKVFRSLSNREQISFPVRDLEDLASLALLIMICHV